MSFMFQCPNGHVLEGDPSHAGQQCQCPTCGILFIIPAPVSPTAPSGPPWNANQPSFTGGAAFHVGPPSTPNAPGFPFTPASSGFPDPTATSPVAAQPEEEKLYHIPCPNGHELETPGDMLGQDVLCPHCNVQFRLREKDSVEYKRIRAEEMKRHERKLGNAWLNWAIVIGVLVLLGLVLLIFSGTSE